MTFLMMFIGNETLNAENSLPECMPRKFTPSSQAISNRYNNNRDHRIILDAHQINSSTNTGTGNSLFYS